VDFKNNVIIMTSNVGSSIIRDANRSLLGQPEVKERSGGCAEASARYAAADVQAEFLNRVDDIIVFNSLTKEHLA